MADPPNILPVECYKHCICIRYVSVFFNNAVQNEGDDNAAGGGGWKRGFRELYSHDAVLTPLGSTHIDFGPNDVWKN
jgi:hypothetical protein